MRLDTELQRATPEGVMLSLRVAGPPIRLLAWGVDFAIIMMCQVLFALLIPFMGEFGGGLYLIGFFVVWWFYPVFFEVLRGGSTPGKKAMGLQVVHDDGTPVGWTASLMRNLLHFADFLPFGFGFGLVSMLASQHFKRLGDWAAGTVVIYRDRELTERRVPERTPIAPPVPLDRQEQRAIIEFGERLPTWNQMRAQELGDVVAPLTGSSGRDGVQRLLGMANWLLGRSGGGS